MGNWTYWQILERSLGNPEVAGLRRLWCFLPISRSLLPKRNGAAFMCRYAARSHVRSQSKSFPALSSTPRQAVVRIVLGSTCPLVKQVVIEAVGALTIPTQVSVLLLSFNRKSGQNDDVLSLAWSCICLSTTLRSCLVICTR